MHRKLLARLAQVFVVFAVETVTVFFVTHLPGVGTEGLWPTTVVLAALLLGVANAVVRPLMIAATVPMGVMGFAVVTTGLNVLLLGILQALGMVRFSSGDSMAMAAAILALVNAVVSTLSAIDAEDRFYRRVIRRLLKAGAGPASREPGLLVVEIDGLAYPYLQVARQRGWVPSLSALLRDGRHVALQWHCGIPSQTSSSQAGIMYGDTREIPGFRWYDRQRGALVVSGNARDARELESRLSHGRGLLKGGSSVNNLLSGDASTAALTLSRMDEGVSRSGDVLAFFSDPYCLVRTLILATWEILVHGFQSLMSLLRTGSLEGHGALYPLQRALSTVVLRDLSTFLVVRDLIQGVPAIYVSYIGYDVVAHSHGPTAPEALGVLATIDRQVGRLVEVARRFAPRPYRVVVLSDHGQSPGQSFQARHGLSLTQLVQALVEGSGVRQSAGQHPAYLRALLEELRRSEGLPSVGTTRRRVLQRSRHYLERKFAEGEEEVPPDKVVVCCSGNLAHIYLGGRTRLQAEEITARYPRLLPGLLSHPGVGFVVVDSSQGPLVLGREGVRRLRDDTVEGSDPLLPFGDPPRIARQLATLVSFTHCGDVVVNSALDGDEVYSFEPQTGSHGGLGGPQNQPFLICPAEVAPWAYATSPADLYQALWPLNPVLAALSPAAQSSAR